MVDYLVVGLGLAGISFCHTLEKNGKSFYVISDTSQRSSWVAGGLYNPVVLKRIKLAWRAAEQMKVLKPFYRSLEQTLGIELDYPVAVRRRLASIEEQNMWFEAADRRELSRFLKPALIPNENPALDAPFGFGEVLGTGRIDTRALVEYYGAYLSDTKRLSNERLEFKDIRILEDGIGYGQYEASKIVFTTGFGLSLNHLFNYLPLQGTKGELLTIKAEQLKEEHVVKSSVFIIPLGEDLYRVGATYKWKDKTNTPTAEARKELTAQLESFLRCEYKVVDQIAGIRPTVADRRPLVGQHPEYKNMYVLNGFGSRGVMIGPYAADLLYRFIEKDEKLPEEMDIARFAKRYRPA